MKLTVSKLTGSNSSSSNNKHYSLQVWHLSTCTNMK